MLAGVLVSLVHAWLSISVKADQIISGTIINIAAFGITGYLISLLSVNSPESAGQFKAWNPPQALIDLPGVGWLFDTILGQGPLTVGLIVIVIAFQISLFRTRWGLRSRAVGEHPRAAETVGIDVIRLRYRNVMLGGVLAGLGGAFLSMEATATFQPGMTVGKGFIGLAAMIVGRWTPIGAFGAALLFASTVGISQSILIAPPPGQLGDMLDLAAAAVLRRAAVPRDHHHPGRRRRPEHPAGRRRPAVRARGRDLTREERDRAAAFLDLQEGRGPVDVLDDAGIERVLRATRRIAVVGASSDPRAAVARCPPHAGRASVSTACRSTRTSARCWGWRPTRTWPTAVAATGPVDMVDVFRRSELCVPHAVEAVAAGARVLWLQLGVVNWEAARIARAGGLEVVMDRCTAIEWGRIGGR